MTYRIEHSIEDGIERIIYRPANQRFETPLLLQHGMWHGAWCWQPWQKLFADWGWESHAHSLPGHGRSVTRRPLRWCTLGYYDEFFTREVNRMGPRPVIIGHSMGGALVQRYLRNNDDLPAAVLAASWPSRNLWKPIVDLAARHPYEMLLGFLTLSAQPARRTAAIVGDLFLSEGALVTPEDLRSRLDPESLLVVLQYFPPFWRPPTYTRVPLLWLGGTCDIVTAEYIHRASAADYGADYIEVQAANHDLMWERSSEATAHSVHDWLVRKGVQ